jgi:amidophosphoribosyltransferase
LVAASRQPIGELCRACFDGKYPVPVADADRLGKFRLESPADLDAPAGGDTSPDGLDDLDVDLGVDVDVDVDELAEPVGRP